MLFSKYVSYFMPAETYGYMETLKNSDAYLAMDTHEMLNIIFQKEIESINLQNSRTNSSVESTDDQREEPLVINNEQNSAREPSIKDEPMPPQTAAAASFDCSQCNEKFTTDLELSQHINTHSINPGPYKCSCGDSFAVVHQFIQHNYKCLNLKPRIKLEPIIAKFGNSINITSDVHEVKVSTPIHKCQNCGRKFRTSSSLFLHKCQRTLTTTNPNYENTASDQKLEQPLALTCYNRADSLVKRSPNKIVLICQCGIEFDDYQQYLDHSRKCNQSRSAQLMVTTFRTRSSPLKVLPNENGKFQCPECSKSFSSNLSLRQHYDGTHREVPKYSCPYCHKRYKWCTSFNYHKRNCSARSENGL